MFLVYSYVLLNYFYSLKCLLVEGKVQEGSGLWQRFDTAGGDADAGTAQHVDADKDFGLAVEFGEFALQAAHGAFDDTHLLAGPQGLGAELDGFIGIVEHELEALHLDVGHYGGCTLSAQHHVAADG